MDFSDYLTRSAALLSACAILDVPVRQAAARIAHAFKSNGKLLVAGNGGSAADAQHFAAEFVAKFKTLRRPLPALAIVTDCATLTAVANDFDFDKVFSRPLEALFAPPDVFLAISTSGRSPNILNALAAAGAHKSIFLTGQNYEAVAVAVAGLTHAACTIIVPSRDTALIQQAHGVVLHAIVQMVEEQLDSPSP